MYTFLFVARAFKNRHCKSSNNGGDGRVQWQHTPLCVRGNSVQPQPEHDDHGEEGNGARERWDLIKVKCTFMEHLGWFCSTIKTLLVSIRKFSLILLLWDDSPQVPWKKKVLEKNRRYWVSLIPHGSTLLKKHHGLWTQALNKSTVLTVEQDRLDVPDSPVFR